MPIAPENITAQDFFRSPFGRWVRHIEYQTGKTLLADIAGAHALQLSTNQLPLLKSPLIGRQWLINRHSQDINSHWQLLPFSSQSLDLVSLVHTLEACDDARAVLREAVRVLRPQGHLLVVGFNPWSALALSKNLPWQDNWLAINRLKDWLAFLDMQPVASRYEIFLPSWRWCYQKRPLKAISHIGKRWLPLTGGVFFVHTIKNRYKPRLIVPTLKKYSPAPAIAI